MTPPDLEELAARVEAETITGVAIVDGKGRLWSLPAPNRHHHIFALAALLGDSAEGNSRGQGFITSKQRFVERADALAIARAAGQVPEGRNLGHQLFSEDVW